MGMADAALDAAELVVLHRLLVLCCCQAGMRCVFVQRAADLSAGRDVLYVLHAVLLITQRFCCYRYEDRGSTYLVWQ
jgi:hypothetical protein